MEYMDYIVKPGDSWWSIANDKLKCGSRYKELMLLNNATSNSSLIVGQSIKIPAIEKQYIVKSGDSWWSIALNEMGSGNRYKELANYNNKEIRCKLTPGDELKIPL